MRKYAALVGLMSLFLLNCGGDPDQELLEASRTGNLEKVQSVLQGTVNIETQTQ